MSDEELHIKIVVDSTDAQDKTDKITDGFRDGAKGAEGMSESTKQLLMQLKRLTGIDLVKMFTGPFAQGKKEIRDIKRQIQDTTAQIAAAQKKMEPMLKPIQEQMQQQLEGAKQTIAEGQAAYAEAELAGDTDAMQAYGDRISEAKEEVEGLEKAIADWPKGAMDYAQFDKSNPELQAQVKAYKDQEKQLDTQKTKQSTLLKQQKSMKKELAKDAVAAGAIGIAIAAAIKLITAAVNKLKQAISEVKSLYQTSIQKNIGMQQYKDIEYLTSYLGVTNEQLAQLMETNKEDLAAILTEYRKLNGSVDEVTESKAKELNQSTTKLKAAWDNVWQDISISFIPSINRLAEILQHIHGTSNGVSEVTTEYVDQLKDAAYYSQIMHNNLMGFDEINALSSQALDEETIKELFGDSEVKTELADSEEEILHEVASIGEGVADVVGATTDAIVEDINSIGDEIEDIETEITIDTSDVDIPVVVDEPIVVETPVIDTPVVVDEQPKTETPEPEKPAGGITVSDVGTIVHSLFSESLLTMLAAPLLDDDRQETVINIVDAVTGNTTFFDGQDWGDTWQRIAQPAQDVIDMGKKFLNETLPGWWDKLFGKKMASGGVAYGPTFAEIGEYAGANTNPEIVAPQSIIYETVQSANGNLADVYAQCTRQLIQAINAKDLSVNIDDNTIAQSAARGNNTYRRMTGKALFVV